MYASRRTFGLIIGFILLVVLIAASFSIGSNPIPISHVWDLLFHANGSVESDIIHQQRIPRTVLVILVGAALGVAGALMQSLTRNPLADPGILGVNAGAALAVVIAVAIAGVTSIWFYL